MRSQEALQACVAWSSKNGSSGTQQPKRKAALTDGEIVDRPQKRDFPWNRLGELSQSPNPGPGLLREDIEKLYLRGSCVSALRYLRSLSRTMLSTVRVVHIESGLLIADDNDNRSYVNELWAYLATYITLRSISVVVLDDMIASAKKN